MGIFSVFKAVDCRCTEASPGTRGEIHKAKKQQARFRNRTLIGATVREAPHCWQRRNMMRVPATQVR